jgi:hypothetical protein
MTKYQRQTIAMTVLILWVTACAVAFWWFQFRHISAFDEHLATFSGSSLSDTKVYPETGGALVVHFVDPFCPCSRFSTSHIEKLESSYSKTAEFIDLNSTPVKDERARRLKTLPIPVGPAVAIWDKNGEFAYLGPYSGGNFCGQGTDFVSITLNSLNEGKNPSWINQEAVGSFCPWSHTWGT